MPGTGPAPRSRDNARVSGDLCTVDDCPNPAARGGICWGHIKKRSRTGGLGELERRPKSKQERVYEAALTYAGAESDDEFERARENLRKSSIAAGQAFVSELTREALARLREQGVRLGRPPKVEPAQVAEAVSRAGSAKRAASQLGVSLRTIRRALRAHRDQQLDGAAG